MRYLFHFVLACLMLAPAIVPAQRGPGRPPMRKGVPPGHGKNIVDRWGQMSPGERRRVLNNVPPERKKQLEDRLDKFQNLPAKERKELRNRYELFSQLPPEKQNRARRLFRSIGDLPEDRRIMIRKEFEELREFPDADRRARINSEEFRNKYTLSEQQMLQDLSELTASPPAAAAAEK